jgi:hypothetical protein
VNITGNDPELVTLTTPASGEASVNFDTAASNPSNGYYVISDIEEVGNIDTTAAAYNDGDSFVFGSPSVDAGLLPYTLNIETPDRSQATNASETGTFVTDDADVDGEVAGVAGDSVPNSVSDTDNDGDIIDEVNNDQSDWTQDFNTDTSNIDTPTANVDRLYRINATVTDALGTPLNNSDYSDIRVDFDGSVDPTSGGNPTGDNAKFEMVNGPDVAPMTDDGILALGDGNSAGLSSSSTNDEVAINNEDGTFQYDIEVESAGDDGVYTPVFETEAQANVAADPTGKSDASQSPTIRNPVVNVFGENGGELPVSQTSDNQILANDLPNQLRVEAFPADADGFVLPSGIQYSLAGSFAENQVSTSTQNINNVETSQLATEGFDEGQIGFFQATPTGTGVGFASLRQGSSVGPVVRDQDGNRTLFDVLSTNRGLDLSLTPSNPTAQDDITVTATDDSTGDVVEDVTITVESPTDNTTTILTDEDGEAIIPSSFTDESGTYSIETRRAGYAGSTASFDVAGVPDPAEFEVSNVQPDGATVDEGADITVTADIENVGDQTGTQDVEFRLNATGEPLDGDAVVDNKTVNLDGGNTTTVSFDVTAPANNGTYDHGVFTNDDSATATLTVENQTDWTEVTGDGNLELGDLGTAIQEYQGNGEINGVTIELGDLGSLINYYQNNN